MEQNGEEEEEQEEDKEQRRAGDVFFAGDRGELDD